MYMKRIIPALTVMVLWAGLQFAGPWAETLKIITDPMATALILAGSLAALYCFEDDGFNLFIQAVL